MFSIETTLKYLTLFVVPHPVREALFWTNRPGADVDMKS
jgi:hypothetical protein